MYICEKDNDKDIINIYSLNAKIEKLKRYKAAILLAGKRESLFYKFSTTDGFEITTARNGSTVKLDSNKNTLEKEQVETTYPYSEKLLIQQCIISKYLNSELNNATMLTIDKIEKNNHINRDFLITTDVKTDNYNFNGFTLENLLNLPKELSTIHLIESNNLNELYKRVIYEKLNIDEQLELFRLNYIDSIDYKDIEKLYNAGLISKEPYYECKMKIAEGSKILKMIKH